MAATSDSRPPLRVACAPGSICRADAAEGGCRLRHGLPVCCLPVCWVTLLARVLVFCELAELVEPLGGTLAQHIRRLGAGLGRQQRYLAAMVDALLEHLLRELRVLRDPILGRRWLGKV